jgi:hypothetical protein
MPGHSATTPTLTCQIHHLKAEVGSHLPQSSPPVTDNCSFGTWCATRVKAQPGIWKARNNYAMAETAPCKGASSTKARSDTQASAKISARRSALTTSRLQALQCIPCPSPRGEPRPRRRQTWRGKVQCECGEFAAGVLGEPRERLRELIRNGLELSEQTRRCATGTGEWQESKEEPWNWGLRPPVTWTGCSLRREFGN